MRWSQVRPTQQFQGSWVALDNCRHDPVTRQPVEGDVVDSDEDLTDLCRRMREMGRSSCAVLYCSGEVFIENAEPSAAAGGVTGADSGPTEMASEG